MTCKRPPTIDTVSPALGKPKAANLDTGYVRIPYKFSQWLGLWTK